MLTLFFIDLGRKVLGFMYFIGGLANLAVQTVYLSLKPPFKYEQVIVQLKKAGYDSFPIVSVVSLFIGFIFALQSAYFMQKLG